MDILTELTPIFYPRSIAVIGASNVEGNTGRLNLKALTDRGFPKLYPVNLEGSDVLGLKGYSSVKQVQEDVDLALVTVPRSAVPSVVRECTEKGVKGVSIFTAGFGELGPEGKALEQKIARIARTGITRLIGPSSAGIYNPAAKVTHLPNLPEESGYLALISHSGYLVSDFVTTAAARGMASSKAVSCGNESDLTAVDFLEYLGEDPETKMIAAYLEGVKDGRRFFRLARNISPGKPIFLWKGGISADGAKSAVSHTGALAGTGHVWEAVCTQTGIIPVDSFEQLIDVLVAFYHLPLAKGRRVAIFCSPGGFAVATCDACIALGLTMAQFSEHTRTRLAEVMPPVGTIAVNPVGLSPVSIHIPGVYRNTLETFLQDENIDMFLFALCGTEVGDDSVLAMLGELLTQMAAKRPVVVASTAPEETTSPPYRWLAEKGIPVYRDPMRAAIALAKLADYSDFVRSCTDS
jgi:acyl-CoA synthetase (NDP forming)